MAKDVAAQAENVIKSLCYKDRDPQGNIRINLKTNQIRKFLTAVNTITRKIDICRVKNNMSLTLSEDLAAEVKYLKIKIAYQAGRERTVKEFVEKAQLITKIDEIGDSVERYEQFAKYVEALVAYHKFYGGRD